MAIQMTGLASGVDTGSMIEELMNVERMSLEKLENEKLKVEWEDEVWKEMNTKLYDFFKDDLFDFKSSSTYSTKNVTSSNESLISMNDSSDAVVGSHSISVSSIATGSYLTGHGLEAGVTGSTKMSELLAGFDSGTRTINIKSSASSVFDESNEITIESTDTVAGVLEKIKNLDIGINARLDTNYNRIFLSSQKTGEDVQLEFDTSDTGAADIMEKLGFLFTDATDGSGRTANAVATPGTDAAFEYNGVSYTSDKNAISINGLAFTIQGQTGTVTINITQDTDAIYEGVKKFVNSYNKLVTEMTEKVYAKSAFKYDMLTKEEKEAMSDDEVEAWEDRIKGALLRRDSVLSELQSGMREIMTMSMGVEFEAGSDYKFLSELGIVTGEYTERGLLHIEGDEDDSAFSGKPNKLMDAIKNNPDGMKDFFTKIGNKLYTTMSDKMKSTKTSSALTFYNNKTIDTRVDEYEKRIAKMEERLEQIEQRYYTQFTAMEKAIQKSNSTGDWLAQQLAAF